LEASKAFRLIMTDNPVQRHLLSGRAKFIVLYSAPPSLRKLDIPLWSYTKRFESPCFAQDILAGEFLSSLESAKSGHRGTGCMSVELFAQCNFLLDPWRYRSECLVSPSLPALPERGSFLPV